jgi:hypothetical protein
MSVYDKGIGFSIEIGKIGVRRKVRQDKVQVRDDPDASVRMLHVSKEILECAEYDAIESLDNYIRVRLAKFALPSMFRRGVYLVPLDLLQRVDEMCEDYRVKRAELVENFLKVYEGAVRAAREKLGTLYNPKEYPALSEVRASFDVQTRYLDFNPSGKLATINAGMFKRETERFQNQLENAAEEIKLALRESFGELVNHMANKLTPDSDGEKKIFRDSLVLNMREFLDTFKARNIADDAELEKLVEDTKKLLNGIDAESIDLLRQPGTVKETVAAGMIQIKTALDTSIETLRKGRKFSFDDEGANDNGNGK